jgi:hypothetical protein
VTSAYDRELMAICFTNAPLMKVIPKREVALFARMWCTRGWSANFPSVFFWPLFVVADGSLALSRSLILSILV